MDDRSDSVTSDKVRTGRRDNGQVSRQFCDGAPNCAPWLWPNLLSLDAPLVAVLWQAMFVRAFHAGSDALPSVVLVLTVWLIYVADRVLDAATGSESEPRHRFYRRHWRWVLPVWSAVFTITGRLAWSYLTRPLFLCGLGLLAGVLVYLFAVHLAPDRLRQAWPKEAAVAIVFALGASLAAWTRIRSAGDAAAIVLFSCLCWINCVAIEQWERRKFAAWPIGRMAIAVGAAALLLLFLHRPMLGEAETASAFAFVLLDRGRSRFSKDALRVMADAALLTPLLFLPLFGILA